MSSRQREQIGSAETIGAGHRQEPGGNHTLPSKGMTRQPPAGHSTYGEMLEVCREVTRGGAELVWVDDQWLSAQEVTPWTEIPLWRTDAGAWNVASARAHQAGLSCRPLRETVAGTWAWMLQEQPMPHPRAADIGIDPAKERRLLDLWLQRPRSGPGSPQG